MTEIRSFRNDYVNMLPGRIRLKVPGLRGNAAMAASVRGYLSELPGVQDVQVNLTTGRLLVLYHMPIDGYSIIIFVDERRRLSERSTPIPSSSVHLAPECANSAHSSPAFVNSAHPSPAVSSSSSKFRWQRNYTLMLGSALTAVLFKQLLLGRSSLSRSRALSEIALALSLVTGYPFFERTLEHLPAKIRVKSHHILGYVSLAILVLQESVGELLISLLINSANLIGVWNISRSHRRIKSLGVLPHKAWTLVNGQEIYLPSDRLEKGDITVVHAGETITVDGKVLAGQAEVDERKITGYPGPIVKETGQQVLAGSEVLAGSVQISLEHIGPDTCISQMIQRVNLERHGINAKDQTGQQYIDRLAHWSLIASALTFLITGDTSRTITMLLAGLPTAAGLAAPVASAVAIGEAAHKGVYSREIRDVLVTSDTDAIAFDKTGALTTGKARIHDVALFSKKYGRPEIMRLAMLAKGISYIPTDGANRGPINHEEVGSLALVEEMQVLPGLGLRARIDGHDILVGSKDLMETAGVRASRAETKFSRFYHQGYLPEYMAIDGKLAAILAVQEALRPHSLRAVEKLRALGIKRIILFTGDTQDAAQTVGGQLGIPETYSGMSPEQKAAAVQSLKHQGFTVTVVGDGIDDGLAMGEADSSIALGSQGGDSAARVAAIVTASRDPHTVVEVVRLSQKTREIIRQNLILTLSLNMIGLVLGATGLVGPVQIALLENIATIGVIFNSVTIPLPPETGL